MIELTYEVLKLRAENESLRAAYTAMERELSEVYALLPGSWHMDPPDGGDVHPLEQIKRLAKDAEKWRKCSTKYA